IIARHVQYARSGEILLASGHKGIGYYPPGQAWKDLVADPIRIYELALKRLPPPPHAGPAPVIGELMGQVRREETRKHRWLIEDRILHLARTDLSPRGFLLLETGGGSRLTGELHVIPWADGDTGSTHCPSGWEPGIKLPGAAGRAYPAGLTLRCRFQVPRR
ncbi:MAG: hypothetical protein LRS48_01130, partial [Desulfurococcales archaeon]|nr:hypothetical protein [Desulfurococcales archaeon]